MDTTSEVKHTPGPWHFVGTNVYSGIEDPRGGFSQSDQIAICDYMQSAEGKFRHQREANARLIAAAPDMLEALHLAAELIAHCQRDGCPAGPIAVPSRIRDAIAKATGGNQA